MVSHLGISKDAEIGQDTLTGHQSFVCVIQETTCGDGVQQESGSTNLAGADVPAAVDQFSNEIQDLKFKQ